MTGGDPVAKRREGEPEVAVSLSETFVHVIEARVLAQLVLSPEFREAVAASLDRPLRWLDIRQVSERTRKGLSTIRRDVKAGTFPAPCAYEGGKALWREADVEGFMKEREAASQIQAGAA